ncbi:hypothetical protein EV182_002647 [Spiromyces aspiralis]|uniref:Uncharacterized protein n=1 Tax=Spiromyces aspiralis TaxID=68401 RepID=A0ACC1HTQ6_9FUNG|nr:hypothetical protein EV182_002647 [Spiromyces aspiralis]
MFIRSCMPDNPSTFLGHGQVLGTLSREQYSHGNQSNELHREFLSTGTHDMYRFKHMVDYIISLRAAARHAMTNFDTPSKSPPFSGVFAPFDNSIGFWSRSLYVLSRMPDHKAAERLLTEACIKVYKIIVCYDIRIGKLAEMYDLSGREGGCNIGRGLCIHVVLRESRDSSRFLPTDQVTAQLLHELVHCFVCHGVKYDRLLSAFLLRLGEGRFRGLEHIFSEQNCTYNLAERDAITEVVPPAKKPPPSAIRADERNVDEVVSDHLGHSRNKGESSSSTSSSGDGGGGDGDNNNNNNNNDDDEECSSNLFEYIENAGRSIFGHDGDAEEDSSSPIALGDRWERFRLGLKVGRNVERRFGHPKFFKPGADY